MRGCRVPEQAGCLHAQEKGPLEPRNRLKEADIRLWTDEDGLKGTNYNGQIVSEEKSENVGEERQPAPRQCSNRISETAFYSFNDYASAI